MFGELPRLRRRRQVRLLDRRTGRSDTAATGTTVLESGSDGYERDTARRVVRTRRSNAMAVTRFLRNHTPTALATAELDAAEEDDDSVRPLRETGRSVRWVVEGIGFSFDRGMFGTAPARPVPGAVGRARPSPRRRPAAGSTTGRPRPPAHRVGPGLSVRRPRTSTPVRRHDRGSRARTRTRPRRRPVRRPRRVRPRVRRPTAGPASATHP